MLAVLAGPASAHAVAEGAGLFDPWIAGPLALVVVLYAIGVARMGRLPPGAAAFAAGCACLALALAAPVERLTERSFAVHMLQHEALMLVAAPLLVAARPLAVLAWALPRRARRYLRPWPWLSAPSAPLAATLLQLAVLVAWHAPRLFDAAVTHRGLHALQHATFLVAALWFFWALRARHDERDAPRASACLFLTMIGCGALGALLTFAASPWYSAYAHAASPFGWSALEEQQVGGLVMWVPAGTVYAALALHRLHRFLERTGGSKTPPRATALRGDARKRA